MKKKASPSTSTKNSLPHNFTIELINWQILAGKGGQLKEDKLAEAIQAAAANKVDVILNTELGTTPMSAPLSEGPYIRLDYAAASKGRPRSGCFFQQSSKLQLDPTLPRSRYNTKQILPPDA